MAAPGDITVKTLKGSWTLDKPVSNNMDGILKLQGVSWLSRKAISAATLTLNFTSGVEPSQSSGEPTVHLTMRQTLTGGIGASTEERIMDWVERERSNHIYGDVLSRSRLIKGAREEDNSVRPDLDLQSKPSNDATKEEVQKFLRGAVGQADSDDLTDLFIHDFGRNEKSGWTAEQIWSIEVLDAQKCLIRRVAVVRDDEYELARLVYKFSGL
ncbi:hypothetical protein BDW68DRAFT_177353 [Aspergillus falconensis]